MTLPTVRSDPWYTDRIIWRDVREPGRGCAGRRNVGSSPFDLTRRRHPKENILLVEGTQGLVATPRIHRGAWQVGAARHLAVAARAHESELELGVLTGPVLRWLVPRLDKPAIEEPPTRATQPDAAPNAALPHR